MMDEYVKEVEAAHKYLEHNELNDRVAADILSRLDAICPESKTKSRSRIPYSTAGKLLKKDIKYGPWNPSTGRHDTPTTQYRENTEFNDIIEYAGGSDKLYFYSYKHKMGLSMVTSSLTQNAARQFKKGLLIGRFTFLKTGRNLNIQMVV